MMINENNRITMENLCRSCMRECDDMKSIFTLRECKGSENGQNLKLVDMLMACTTVKVNNHDGLPILMCTECELKLCVAYDFKTLCEQTEITLKNLIQNDAEQIEIKADIDIPDYVDDNNSGESECESNEAKKDNYTCKICDETLDSKKDVLAHMRIHTSEESDLVDVQETTDDGNLKRQFECKYCNKVLTTAVGLKIHTRRHTGLNLHTCNICDKSYTKESHLKRHKLIHKKEVEEPVVTIEKKDRIMECEFCDRVFKYKKSFNHHLQVEHGMANEVDTVTSPSKLEDNEERIEEDKETIVITPELPDIKPSKVHACHVCDAKFTRSNHLTRHMTLHRNLLTHKCDRCDKAFATTDYLKKHIQEDHIEKAYDCSICKKGFTRGEHLIRHLKVHLNTKNKEENLKCSICEKDFTRSDHLARHLKIHLQQDKRHACNICGKTFNRLDNLKSHQRIHTGEKRDSGKLHLCIYCGKEFNNSSNMIVHMRRHTGERPYKCTQCGKGFPRSHDLKCHERTHSGERPYLCTLCGKSFNKSNKLLRHTRIHTGERPYVCNLCGRAFTQSNDLALHLRRHTGSRPYACGVCSARFIQSGQLKAHRRSTGHWMETQPDLKGGHRVEPVVPLSDPVPIKFKTYGKSKKNDVNEDVTMDKFNNINDETVMNNLNDSITVQPIIVDGNKILEQFHNAGFVATVMQQNEQNNKNFKLESGGDGYNLQSNVKCESSITTTTTTDGRNNAPTFQTSTSTENYNNHPDAFNYQTYG